MASVTLASAPKAVARAAVNPWVIALTVTLATFMELLDTSIANVSLPYIAGGLGRSATRFSWRGSRRRFHSSATMRAGDSPPASGVSRSAAALCSSIRT